MSISDPFNLNPLTFNGFDVHVSPNRPKYELPPEVIPGVPWPPGFREEFNVWALSFFGTTNLVPKGQCYMLYGHTIIMRPEDVATLSNFMI